jgi:2-dehydro-3-deoxygluconokinase
MSKVACIGECMIELRQTTGNELLRGYGGDTLNTAVYLARLGVAVDYVTALGDDPLSDEMIAGWMAEGIGISRVVRLPGKLPGLYLIQTDPAGERRFYHWRENSAARSLMALPQTDEMLTALAGYDMVYLSAITLSLYEEGGRRRLFAALDQARGRNVKIAFDTNFRTRGWPDLAIARRAYQQAFAVSDIVIASTEDLMAMYPGERDDALLARLSSAEAVLKRDEPSCIVRYAGRTLRVEADPVCAPVVDTTAAGDSFAAAYLAARLGGADPVAAAQAGHRLAGAVVCHRGAIIPRHAMPEHIVSAPPAAHEAV